MCEQLGQEPNPDEMPPDDSMFPLEVQEAFYVHTMLPDKWDGSSGSYMGKDWSALGDILEITGIEDKQVVCFFLKYVENANMVNINDELKRKRDAEQRRTKAGK